MRKTKRKAFTNETNKKRKIRKEERRKKLGEFRKFYFTDPTQTNKYTPSLNERGGGG